MTALPQAGFRGVNVTIPHKEAALALGTDPTDRARAIGAANTLVFEPDGRIAADNTDAPGLIAALPIRPAGLTALVLGAGGALARRSGLFSTRARARLGSGIAPPSGGKCLLPSWVRSR